MITVEHLCKEFKVNKKYEGLGGTFKSFFSREYTIKRAIDDLSFNVGRGEMAGYIGLNGAGKSTTIKILSGLMEPTQGICTVNGMIPYRERKRYTKNIGVVFGNRSQLWWDLPVSESFSVLQKIYEVPKEEFSERLDFLIEILGIKEFYLTPVRNLSLGQKMRADLAASMLHNPAVLFLDEPTIGLDIIVKEKIRQAIKKINKETNTTVLLTTHDLDDIEEICNKIIVIDKGKKIFDGSLDELKNVYAITRTVHFEFKEETTCLIDIRERNGILNVENEEKNRISIKFLKKEVDFPELMQDIVGKYDVTDFIVEEPKLEEIVKGIYTKDCVYERGNSYK
ncbi:ABC transporter ATP-binding protein [Anaerosacchariphilus polymeriproducens]|uniref:ATP-binding cassette domain-containing protein n=1 Tax=Anaerosacchariphilus polymeriproducens TaxID=1812858 RepID=A0A371ASF3_9FIRM|nr:ATP-binding cassette domain-containing protein [Anaerosacchariphilus polymeriproducens]RDU22508.1 ATP-binding cassette domain-containing protein [Anaerosacchariphilus polymeriproducens]